MIWRAPVLCGAIKKVLNPANVIDVGCAIGDIVQGFLDLGIDCHGIEGSYAAAKYLVCDRRRIAFIDLRDHIRGRSHDLLTSFEVIEHVEPEFEGTVLDNLCRLSSRLLISIAQPGQEGYGHVNLKPQTHWNSEFAKRGYLRKAYIEEAIRDLIFPWHKKVVLRGIYGNIMFYEKS